MDNGRDMANKVSSLTFRAGKVAVAAADDGQQAAQQLTILKTIEVESRYAGWIHCFLTDSAEATASAGNQQQHILRVEMRGPDNTVRLRQVKLIGKCAADDDLGAAASPVALPNRAESARIQQSNCEEETLRVFRLITSQAGSLERPTDDDILFHQKGTKYGVLSSFFSVMWIRVTGSCYLFYCVPGPFCPDPDLTFFP